MKKLLVAAAALALTAATGTAAFAAEPPAALAGQGAVSAVDAPSATALTNGVPVAASGTQGSERLYAITVPAGSTNLVIATSGGTGDVDLYTRRDAVPTSAAFDCRPYQTGNVEKCTVATPVAGTYYVLLKGYSAYSGVTLTATFRAPSGSTATTTSTTSTTTSGTELVSGTPVTVSGAAGSERLYRFVVPQGATRLTVTTSGGTGDVDLYLRKTYAPTSSAYDCRPYQYGNNESCTISAPAAGLWYVRLYGYGSYSGVTLKATVDASTTTTTTTSTSPVVKPIPLGSSEYIQGVAGDTHLYSVTVPYGTKSLSMSLGDNPYGSGAATVVARVGAIPTTSVNDCYAQQPGSAQCSLADPPAGATVYILVTGLSDTYMKSLQISAVGQPDPVIPGAIELVGPVTLSGAAGSDAYYYVTIPDYTPGLQVMLKGGSGNADLSVLRGALPTDAEYACRSTAATSTESCSVSTYAGKYYIRVHGTTAFSGVELSHVVLAQ